VSGEVLKSCTMIITEANESVAEVHDRMPELLAEKDFEPWLSGSAGPGIAQTCTRRPAAKLAGIEASE
jgi:putative SOS response-associated peptidase YedK